MATHARNCLIFLIFLLATTLAQAQVVGELVAAENSAQTGSRTTVALKLSHDPGWHTYWVSPGIGEATSITWTLPIDSTQGRSMKSPKIAMLHNLPMQNS